MTLKIKEIMKQNTHHDESSLIEIRNHGMAVTDISELTSLKKEHILMFFEETKIGNEIEFEFIQDGLQAGDACFYTTVDKTLTKKNMNDFGIDVEKYEKNDLLTLFEMPKTMEKYSKIILDKVFELKNVPKKIRVVSTHPFDFNDKKNSDMMADIEQCVDDNFSKIPALFVCSFHTKNIDADHKKEFMVNLLDSHHKVIFVDKDKKLKVFNLP